MCETAQEALKIRRRLTDPDAGNPAAYESDLANSLSNLCKHLWDAGRRGEALEATAEAVEIYRRLIAMEPARFTSGLRTELSLQAQVLLGLGRVQDAQAVRAWLAANPGDPDAHR
ncbi:hypothetical protein OG592_37175 [Streptomyces avidinii]|uniref:hypothetical protein n=1 Tax=Streptomyces avidinii TaxID=1895 RepID=UPI003870B677|nr:hypothetical protein OG592_37175 [Streptomyces avidinii]